MRIIPVMISFIAFLLGQFRYYFIYPKMDAEGKSDERYESAYPKIQKIFEKALRLSGSEIIVHGRENIPTDQAVLYVANHSSFCDIPVLFCNTVHGCGFVAKDSLKKVPLLWRYMSFVNSEFLDRDDVRQGMEVIKSAAKTVKGGHSMAIFPEGTRGQGDEPAEFKEGSLRIAVTAKAPVVPVAIKGTADMMENHKKFILRPATVHITFGEPIDIASLPRAERKHVGATIRQWIIDTNKEL